MKKGLWISLLVIVLAGGGFFVWQQKMGQSAEALSASADSTAVTDSTSADADETDGKDKKKKAAPIPVELAVATARNIPAYFHTTGSLEATRQVDLISKSSGEVEKLLVEEGDFVKKGQVLLELDHREEDLLLEQSKVRASTAKREHERMQELMEKGLGSERELEEKAEIASVNELEAQLAEVRRDNMIVRAPFSGQITVRHIELGQNINVGDLTLSLADVSPLEVRLYLPEKIVKDVSLGQPVEITSDVTPDRVLEGKVERISPAVDPATSTVKVTLQVDNAKGMARVGSFVRARITTDTHPGAIAVPKKALVAEAGMNYLYVAEGDSVLKTAVTTGYADDTFIEITQGINAGQSVVSVGQGGLRNGSKIKDLNAGEADSSQSDRSEELAGNDQAEAGK